jgi:hypothetical protein
VFQEVRLGERAANLGGWAAEVVLPSSVTVRLREGPAPEWVGRLVQAIGAVCSR